MRMTSSNLTLMEEDPFLSFLPMENCTEMFGNASIAYEYNITCLEHAPALTQSAVTRAIVLAAMSFLSLVGNVATIWAIMKDAHRTSLCAMILHLSVADLFVSLFCLAGESVWTYTVAWNAGNIMCKVVKYWQMFGLYLSTFLVVVIGLDRWIAISQPLKRTQSGKGRAKMWTWIAWILSAVFSLPQLLIFRVSKGPFIEDFYQCVTYGFYTAKWQEQLYSILSLLLMFVIPLAILMVTYTSAIVKLRQSERSFQASERGGISHAESNRQRRMRKATKRSLQMSLFIVGGFLVCWMPYYSLYISLLFGLAPEEYGQKLFQNIFFFGMSNSLINPLIYGAFHLWRPNTPSTSSASTASSASLSQKRSSLAQVNRTRQQVLQQQQSFYRSTTTASSNNHLRSPVLTQQQHEEVPVQESQQQLEQQQQLQQQQPKSNGGLPRPLSAPQVIARCATFDCSSLSQHGGAEGRKRASSSSRRRRRLLMEQQRRLLCGSSSDGDKLNRFDYTLELLGPDEVKEGLF